MERFSLQVGLLIPEFTPESADAVSAACAGFLAKALDASGFETDLNAFVIRGVLAQDVFMAVARVGTVLGPAIGADVIDGVRPDIVVESVFAASDGQV